MYSKSAIILYTVVHVNNSFVFSSFKVGNLNSVKDSVPDKLCSRVVYKFSCAGCSARYVGETSQHFTTRVREHLSMDRVSRVYKHLQNSDKCRNLFSEKNFIILGSASTVFHLKIKEALHIIYTMATSISQQGNFLCQF